MNTAEPLLSIRVAIDYPQRPRVLRDVSFDMQRGEVLGLVGQSGSGKSTIALAIMRLLSMKGGTATGSIHFEGRDLLQLPERELRKIRGRDIGLVLQSPLSSLNPALRIRKQLMEAWSAHSDGKTEASAVIEEAMQSVSLPSDDDFLKRFPSEVSVGQAQRVLIAMAILHHPALLIADEATSALDVITQAEIMQLFAQLNRERQMAILYISHDLLSVNRICDRIAILHDGEIVECASTSLIFTDPKHPYTRRLLAAIPERPKLLYESI
jgi:peptide/nickel transport system ATP-binding protein